MKKKAPLAPTSIPPSAECVLAVFRLVSKYYGLLSPGFVSGQTSTTSDMGDGLTSAQLKRIPQLDWIPADYLAFCRFCNGVTLFWQMEDKPELYLHGRICLEPLPKMVRDRAGEMYFKDDPDPSKAPMRDFKVVDACTDETVVGFYYTAACNAELHYYNLEDRPVRLGVDFSGYMALLQHTLGCYHWQELLVELDAPTLGTRPFYPTSYAAQEALARLQAAVPSFDLDAFVTCYDQVRLS